MKIVIKIEGLSKQAERVLWESLLEDILADEVRDIIGTELETEGLKLPKKAEIKVRIVEWKE